MKVIAPKVKECPAMCSEKIVNRGGHCDKY